MIAVLDCRIPSSVQAALQNRGFDTILLPPHPLLPSPVASHPDLLLFFTESLCFTVKSYEQIAGPILHEIAEKTNRTILFCDEEIGTKYPSDILLDAAEIGGQLLCHPKHTSEKLLKRFQSSVIPVHQGYAKCSCVPVSDRALITADSSIVKAARSAGISVLQIEEGGVSLPGYNTGFIGGAASYRPQMDLNEIYFCGNLNLHPSGEKIHQFCQHHGKTAVSLGDFPLTDVGTMFLL
jgi:hypothetical protein